MNKLSTSIIFALTILCFSCSIYADGCFGQGTNCCPVYHAKVKPGSEWQPPPFPFPGCSNSEKSPTENTQFAQIVLAKTGVTCIYTDNFCLIKYTIDTTPYKDKEGSWKQRWILQSAAAGWKCSNNIGGGSRTNCSFME